MSGWHVPPLGPAAFDLKSWHRVGVPRPSALSVPTLLLWDLGTPSVLPVHTLLLWDLGVPAHCRWGVLPLTLVLVI